MNYIYIYIYIYMCVSDNVLLYNNYILYTLYTHVNIVKIL